MIAFCLDCYILTNIEYWILRYSVNSRMLCLGVKLVLVWFGSRLSKFLISKQLPWTGRLLPIEQVGECVGSLALDHKEPVQQEGEGLWEEGGQTMKQD